MKKTIASLNLILIASLIVLAGCCYEEADRLPPAVPRGVRSVTGDGQVLIQWYENTEPDLAGYRVWVSSAEAGPYVLIGETDLDHYLDTGLTNGQTYYYAVSAFDTHDNESELSYETVFDTPRPEGYDVRIRDFRNIPDEAGWDFSSYSIVRYNYAGCDIYYGYEPSNASYYFHIYKTGGLIQDYGYTGSLDDVSYAPDDGWSTAGMVEAIEGHTYIVWTWDNHFAKFRVTDIGSGYAVFDWAYQVDPGNPELIIKH
jgi:hypothetical protein